MNVRHWSLENRLEMICIAVFHSVSIDNDVDEFDLQLHSSLTLDSSAGKTSDGLVSKVLTTEKKQIEFDRSTNIKKSTDFFSRKSSGDRLKNKRKRRSLSMITEFDSLRSTDDSSRKSSKCPNNDEFVLSQLHSTIDWMESWLFVFRWKENIQMKSRRIFSIGNVLPIDTVSNRNLKLMRPSIDNVSIDSELNMSIAENCQWNDGQERVISLNKSRERTKINDLILIDLLRLRPTFDHRPSSTFSKDFD